MLYLKILTPNTESAFSLSFRWFRHISDASNAYKNRQGDRARGGSVGGGGLNRRNAVGGGEENGLLGSSSAAEAAAGAAGTSLGKSHSFHERSTTEAARAAAAAAAAEEDKRDDVLSKTGEARSMSDWDYGWESTLEGRVHRWIPK